MLVINTCVIGNIPLICVEVPDSNLHRVSYVLRISIGTILLTGDKMYDYCTSRIC